MSSVPASVPTPTANLHEFAAYGKLPFDRFVLDHWEYAKPTNKDQQQWDELAKRWLLIDYLGRSSYYETALNLATASVDDPGMPTQEKINRVLVPHQTAQERNLAESSGDHSWLRTCYEPRLASAYTEMTGVYLHVVNNAHLVLNNETLYSDLGSDLTGLFTRAPQLPVSDNYLESEDFDEEQLEDESMILLFNASKDERLLIYLLDEEALQKKMIKLTWFSLGGKLLWWNWLKPSDLQDWEGHFSGLGHRLGWIYELSDSDPRLGQKGVLVELN